MILNNEKSEEMLEIAKPLIKWMNENCHPHCKIIIEPDSVELVEGITREKTTEFIGD